MKVSWFVAEGVPKFDSCYKVYGAQVGKCCNLYGIHATSEQILN